MNTTPKRVSLADINKSLWLLANPMAEMSSERVPPGVRFMPVFVQEMGGGEARLLGADLKPITGENDSAARLKALYADPQVVGVDVAIPASLISVLHATRERLESLDQLVAMKAAGEIFVAAIRAGIGMGLDGWQECARRLHQERYTCHVWFERDRAHVRLVDEFTRIDVVNLWDEAVYEAIEDGYLVRPNGPHPTEEQWHPRVLEYALEIGAIDLGLELPPELPTGAPLPDSPSA